MKARNFEIVNDNDFDSVAKILLSDKTPLRFVRRRAFSPATTDDILSDTAARSLFEKEAEKDLKIHNKWVSTFVRDVCGMAFLWLVFLTLIGALIWFILNGTLTDIEENRLVAIIIFFAVLVLTGAASVFLTVFFICRDRYVKRTFYYLDDLFLVYDDRGNPCAVEIRDKQVRILYGGALYTVRGGKAKMTRKPLKIYRASLNMYTPAALDIKNFVIGLTPVSREKREEWGEIAASTSIGDTGVYLSLNARRNGLHNVAVRVWGMHKILYELDTDFKLKTVYSAATESCFINYRYITRAEVVGRGSTVLQELKSVLKKFPQAEKISDGIIYES